MSSIKICINNKLAVKILRIVFELSHAMQVF